MKIGALLVAGAIACLLASSSTTWITFTDVAVEAGVTAPTIYGGEKSQKYILETTGTGVALFDYDGDDRPDIFIVNGSRLTPPVGQSPTNALYHNLGNGKFEDVTAKAGLTRSGWGQGVCVGDYDNDGKTDLFVTSFGGNALYRNLGNGSFRDVTAQANVAATGRWNSGCTLVDVDLDGWLDIFVANYVDARDAKAYEPGSGPNCKWKGLNVMCGPMGLRRSENILYRNNGDGTFTDISTSSGIAPASGYFCFMPVTLDFNNDGRPDIFVACDSSPNMLFENLGKGKFREVGVESGTAYNQDGREQASMGVAVGDYDNNGYPDILVTNFSDDTPTLYQNNRDNTFSDSTFSAKLGLKTQYLSWGTGFVDFDNDGRKDLFIASGHVYPEVDQHPEISYRQERLVYRNSGDGTFEDFSARTGAAISTKHASRGAAFEDLDGDGDIDVVIVNLNEAPSVLRNSGGEKKNWLILRLEGSRSNRSAIGARVRIKSNGRIQTDEVRSASSYYSSNGLRLHFGLDTAGKADEVEILWPSGARQVVKDVKANQVVVVHEKIDTQ